MNLRARQFWFGRLGLAALLLLVPASAHAHTPIEGAGDFVGGLLHPLTTPSHLLLLLGLGFLLGQRVPFKLKMPLRVFVPVSGTALALTTTGWIAAVAPPILLGLALLIALVVAGEKSLPPIAYGVIIAATALVIGLDSAVESADAWVVTKTLCGSWLCLVIVVFDIAYYVSLGMAKPWMKVGIRVLASWIVAIAVLVLAFYLRNPTT